MNFIEVVSVTLAALFVLRLITHRRRVCSKCGCTLVWGEHGQCDFCRGPCQL